MSEFRSWAQGGGVTSAALSWALHSVLRGLPDEPVRMLKEELAHRGAIGTCPPIPQLDEEPFPANVRGYLTKHRLLEVLERAFNHLAYEVAVLAGTEDDLSLIHIPSPRDRG